MDRLVFFTDAVAAIAITLLVLPLVDSVTEAAHDGLSVEQFIGNNVAAISGFALSFLVIAPALARPPFDVRACQVV